MSLYERWRGIGKNYNADLDYKQKIGEMRGEWEEDQVEKLEVERRGRNEGDLPAAATATSSEHDSVWTDDVHSYYKSISNRSPDLAAKEKEGMH